ncbi:hypothetical protein, partial [uncultured Nevskia sp.]|uniref:hypothetical protein n=1 Tax=uncultured Nevskia sp. TaxID=228950 RepID=UPI0025D10AF8
MIKAGSDDRNESGALELPQPCRSSRARTIGTAKKRVRRIEDSCEVTHGPASYVQAADKKT